jgi:hypothetical protein
MMCAGWMRFRASLVAMEKDCIDAGAAAGAVDSPGNRRPATWHRHVSLVMLAFAEPLDLDTAEASIALDPEQFAGSRKATAAGWAAMASRRRAGPGEGRPSIIEATAHPEGDRRFWGAAPALSPAFPSAWGSAYARMWVDDRIAAISNGLPR